MNLKHEPLAATTADRLFLALRQNMGNATALGELTGSVHGLVEGVAHLNNPARKGDHNGLLCGGYSVLNEAPMKWVELRLGGLNVEFAGLAFNAVRRAVISEKRKHGPDGLEQSEHAARLQKYSRKLFSLAAQDLGQDPSPEQFRAWLENPRNRSAIVRATTYQRWQPPFKKCLLRRLVENCPRPSPSERPLQHDGKRINRRSLLS